MKDIIVVTGGAGFVGSNLIEKLLSYKKNFKIISIDNYSTGKKKNHIIDKKITYLNGSTENIEKLLKKKINKIHSLFHFGEFSRIYQSFSKFEECLQSNSIGSKSVFNFCLRNKIKLIYSATSASLGNSGSDKNLSPYAFTKSKNLELLENLKRWFNFKFEVIYFYNVYGNRQIEIGDMATVIGIFENQYRNGKPLTVVRPGTQSRQFTHIDDTVKVCLEAWIKNKGLHYSIFSKEKFTVLNVAKMFKAKIRYLPVREGERYASALTKMNLNNKIHNRIGKISLKNYITNIVSKKKINCA